MTALPVPVTALPAPVTALPVPVTALPAPVTALPALPTPVITPPATPGFVKNEWTEELICAILRSEWAAQQAVG